MRDDDRLVATLLLCLAVALVVIVYVVHDLRRCEVRGGRYLLRAQVCLARGAVLE